MKLFGKLTTKLKKFTSKKQTHNISESISDILGKFDRSNDFIDYSNTFNVYTTKMETASSGLTILRTDGTVLNVGDILETLLDIGFIVPDKEFCWWKTVRGMSG